ncbi:MAG: hypothetical protein A2V84_04320 [Chloroflexi bacterium RBG_16_70_13]|nr:MAG: hypothetical protein A2V84_04320 [Chloroflexi bacterium RBG_16_70_13]
MHRRSAPFASSLLAVMAVAAACGGSSGGDPYDLLYKPIEADRDPVQVNVGFAVTAEGTSIVVDPSQVGFVVDRAGGSSALHLAIPFGALDIDPATLAPLGVVGDSIDVDIVLDGDAVYARSPILGTLLQTLLAQSGELPDGDLGDWLRLGTTAELESVMGLLGGGAAIPSATMPPAGNAGELKSTLEGLGITLKNEGRQNQNGVDANHVSVSLDVDKLLASDYLEMVSPAELEAGRSALQQVELEVDLWLDASSGNLAEVDVKAASTTGTSGVIELTLRFRDPDGTIQTDAPGSFVELPLQSIVEELIRGGGLLGF